MLAELLASNRLLKTIAAAVVVSGGAMYVANKVRGARHTSKRMIYGPSMLNEFITKSLQPALDQYAPTWWTNTHMQIVLTFLVPQADLRYKRELLDLDDGGQAALDWALESSSHSVHDLAPDAPIVVVLHGLTGCSAAMRSLCAEALERGYRPVVFNKRGHGGVKLTTPKLQAFGCVRDLQQAIAHIERAYPSAKLYGVGFSAGSGLLCSYLGETGAQSRLEAGVMISPGYNALDLFCGGKIHPLYDFLMTFSLKQFLSRHINELQDVIHVPSALKASSIREFDEHVFMKMHGYEDIETYWKYNNPMREADRIERPTLCINALDDPVCTKENIPYEAFKVDPLRVLIETAHGSHCAFYEGHVVLKSWALGVAMDYLTKVREFQGLVPPAQ